MYGKPRRYRPSLRETIERNDARHRNLHAAAGKELPPSFLVPILPPKRERIKRPVDGRPIGPTEHQEQSAVITWWDRAGCLLYKLPYFSLFAVPNGGARDPITGSRLKAEGVRPGALDLILAKPTLNFSGLFIEMKVGDNKPSDKQKAFVEYLNAMGYKAEVHWSAVSAINAIENYLGVQPTC